MLATEQLGIFAQLGLGLAGFSGVALVLTHRGSPLTRLESSRLSIMLGTSLGATFLAILPMVMPGSDPEAKCRVASSVMAIYTVAFTWYYATATSRMRSEAPELVTQAPRWVVVAGHCANFLLQSGSALGIVDCSSAFGLGLFWLLFHAAYQFARILFIQPRSH